MSQLSLDADADSSLAPRWAEAVQGKRRNVRAPYDGAGTGRTNLRSGEFRAVRMARPWSRRGRSPSDVSGAQPAKQPPAATSASISPRFAKYTALNSPQQDSVHLNRIIHNL